MSSNHLKKIAIVGASGQVGRFIVEELLKTGNFTVTAITRGDSSDIPSGVAIKKVNYEEESSLVDALKGQDVLIVTMAVTAPPDTEAKLVKAAADAGVPWILPNEWGNDHVDAPEAGKDTFLGPPRLENHKRIRELGKSSFIAVCCGFWYEHSLGISPLTYGFDFKNRTVTYYSPDGSTRLNTSTFPQVGRAVARLLSLPIQSDSRPCLNDYKNQYVRISSFNTCQKDMFESVKRVTRTTVSDWKIEHEDAKQRYQDGLKKMQSGDQSGFPKMLYARYFFPDDSANFEKRKGLDNDKLGLPKENIDQATEVAIRKADAAAGASNPLEAQKMSRHVR